MSDEHDDITIHEPFGGEPSDRGMLFHFAANAADDVRGALMSKKRSNYMKQADTLFSRFIRERDGACQACGTTEFLQCAHIISRSYKSIRTHRLNAVALCRSDHLRFTHRPLEWREWVEERFPGRWDMLTEIALRYERVDWKAEVERLRELLRDQAA